MEAAPPPVILPLANLCFCKEARWKTERGMASPPEDRPAKPAPAKPLTDLDFRSGVQIEELNQLIQEYDARTPSSWDAPELFQAKDLVFSLLGELGQVATHGPFKLL